MDKTQRLRTAISGNAPDRIPVSAWGHFYVEETDPDKFAEKMLDFFNKFDWDFMKIHARASYHVEGWGFTYSPSNDPKKPHSCTGHPIKKSKDWRNIHTLEMSTPAFEEQIKALRLIKKSLPKDVPVIMTVFSPLDIAEKLVDRDQDLLRAHINDDPESLLVALESITQTFEKFVRKLIIEGIDGLYFSTKWANQGRLSEGQYEQLGKPFDLRILNAAQQLWCNILHVCEDKIRLSLVSDYPVAIFHWDKDAGHNPTYGEGKKQTGKACSGGVNANVLAFGTKNDIIKSALEAIHDTEGKGFILGPGCSVQMGLTSDENFIALRSVVDRL